MPKYDKQYFFIEKADDERLPFLVPDSNSEDRLFLYESQLPGSPPLVFRNGRKDSQKNRRISALTPDILFSGSDLIVKNSIREQLLDKEIPNLHMHPSIYIDNNEDWNEDYWHLLFTNSLDCWDHELSDYNRTRRPIEIGGLEYHEVHTFVLDEATLDKKKLPERLLFKMGGILAGTITCHETLHSIFHGGGNSGAFLTSVNDY
jgi:hypothetical protein